MAVWDDGIAPDVGGTSDVDGTFVLEGMAPDVGGASALSEPYAEATPFSVLPISVVVAHFVYSEPTTFSVLPLEQVVVHFVYNVEKSPFSVITTAEPVPHWLYAEISPFAVLPAAVVVPHWKYSKKTNFSVSPSNSIVVFYSGKPYLVRASLLIDGTDYSDVLFGAVNVSKSDGSATTFGFNIYSPLIPSDFVDKEVAISYQAADGDGIVSGVETIVVGVIREAVIDLDSPTLIEISGYDYSGYHNELGQLYSGEITRILSGTIGITAAGALATGKAPIFNVAYVETAILDVQDGQDYYVDALTGVIYIPVSSKLLNAPSSLNFQYVDPFASFDELAQTIATLKGWTIENDGFTVSDFTEPKKQPIITMSSESVIDMMKKLYEVGGGKLDTSLAPIMRCYSDKINYEGATVKTYTEADIVYGSLKMGCSLFDALTDQTVRSVQNTFSNVIIGDFVEIKNENGSVDNSNWEQGLGLGLWYTGAVWSESAAWNNAVAISNEMGRRDFITVSIPLSDVGEYSFSAGGSPASYHAIYTRYEYDGGTFVKWYQQVTDKNSVVGEWRVEVDKENNLINFILSSTPVIDRVTLDHVQYQNGYIGVFAIYYRRIDWQISISTKNISYGEGVATSQVEVAGTQAVQKIDVKLEGDVYEQPFIETQTQGEDLCKAILHERKFVYNASANIPLHKVGNIKLGNKTEISSRGKSVVGNLKNINYNIDVGNGRGIVTVDVKGFGAGI